MNSSFLFVLLCFAAISVSAQIYFPPNDSDEWQTLDPGGLGWCQDRIDNLYEFLEENQTKAFILLKDGKIVLEQYFNGNSQNSLWYWASAGKSLISFLVGIARQEGNLDLVAPVSDYLGESWTSCNTDDESQITVWNQLTMTTGLDDSVADPDCTDSGCLVCIAGSGTRWAYHNAPYTLLDGVISAATGQDLNSYLNEKVKQITGMTGQFVDIGYNNVFYSKARSMARYGLLVLNGGNWNGTQIMTDSEYFNQMLSSSQELNKSYGYLWWLNGKDSFMIPQNQIVFNGPIFPNAPDDTVAALGKNGQFINVVASQNMVWIRMGEVPESVPVPFLFNDEIWEKINLLDCNMGIQDAGSPDDFKVFPNPVRNALLVRIKGLNKEIEMQVFDYQGRMLKQYSLSKPFEKLDFSGFRPGIYSLKFELDGKIYSKKILKR